MRKSALDTQISSFTFLLLLFLLCNYKESLSKLSKVNKFACGCRKIKKSNKVIGKKIAEVGHSSLSK
jgi:hypothetical protein